MKFPPLVKIRQRFPASRLDDVGTELRTQLADSGATIQPGAQIAIATGSRGIADIVPAIKEVVRWVKSQGGQPFIVPAMGSHGGATAEGQQQVLASYGITEANVNAPIRSSMEVVELPQDNLETPVYFDKNAFEADGTIVVNRVKVHTDYHGPYESGMMKIAAIGLGKHKQAQALHRFGTHGLREIMPKVARQILAQANIILGVGIVENAYEQTLAIRAIPAASIPDEEPKLLELARTHMPSLPVHSLHMLIIDEVGKNISGVGLDTNIIGRMKIKGEPEPTSPDIRVIIIRHLTNESHGNALGMGLADIATKSFYSKIDFKVTYENIFASTFMERAKMPIITQDDAEAVRFGFRACGPVAPADARIIRIRSTLHLDELYVSPTVLEELRNRDDIEVVTPAQEAFTTNGELKPF